MDQISKNMGFTISNTILFLMVALPSCVHGSVNKSAIVGQQVSLACNLTDHSSRVSWVIETQEKFETTVSVCDRQSPTAVCEVNKDYSNGYSASANISISALVINVTGTHKQQVYRCKLGNEVLESYTLVIIDPGNIRPPTCKVAPVIEAEKFVLTQIELQCESTVLEDIQSRLEIKACGNKISTLEASSLAKHVNWYTLQVCSVSCHLSFPFIIERQNCSFPNLIEIRITQRQKEIAFRCDVESSSGESNEVEWRLLDPRFGKQGELDIKYRSWIRDGGKSLLLEDIGDADIGRVVECRIFSFGNDKSSVKIGFAEIRWQSCTYDMTGSPICSKSRTTSYGTPRHDTDRYIVGIIVTGLCFAVVMGFMSTWVYTLYKGKSLRTVLLWPRNVCTNKSQTISLKNIYVDGKGSDQNEKNGNTSRPISEQGGGVVGEAQASQATTSCDDLILQGLQLEAAQPDNSIYVCVENSSSESCRSQNMTMMKPERQDKHYNFRSSRPELHQEILYTEEGKDGGKNKAFTDDCKIYAVIDNT